MTNSYGKFRHIIQTDPGAAQFVPERTSSSNRFSSQYPLKEERPKTSVHRLPEKPKTKKFRLSNRRPATSCDKSWKKTRDILQSHLNRVEAAASPAVIPPVKEEEGEENPSPIRVLETGSREHLQAKACVIAQQYRLKVNELERIRLEQQKKVQQSKKIQRQALGSSLAKAVQDGERQKTQYLLNHYIALGRHPIEPHEEQLALGVVQDWALRESDSREKCDYIWDEMTQHMEQSYLLQEGFKDAPDTFATAVALDCLEKLATKIPDYSRILDVVRMTLDKAIYLNDVESHERMIHRRTYFQAAKEYEELYLKGNVDLKEFQRVDALDPSERLIPMYKEIQDPNEKTNLMFQFLLEASESLDQTFLNQVVEHLKPEIQDASRLGLIRDLKPSMTSEILDQIMIYQSNTAREYFEKNPEPLVLSKDLILKILQVDLDKTAQLFWESPQFISNLLYNEPRILERILDQQSCAVSNALGSNMSLFSSILSNLLRDNLDVVEDYFVKNPHLVQLMLSNQPDILPSCIEIEPRILFNIMMPCQGVLEKIYASHPSILRKIFTRSPGIATELFKRDPSFLKAAIESCPKTLSAVLQKSPIILSNALHLEPTILKNLIHQNPDLLFAPLEQNPSIVSNFLSIFPDLLTPTILEEMGLCQMDELIALTASVSTQTDGHVHTTTHAPVSKAKKKTKLGGLGKFKKKNGPAWSMSEILTYIPTIYSKKCRADIADDQAGFQHEPLPELVQDDFLQQFGMKTAATKQLGMMVSGIKKYAEKDLRIKRFGLLLGVINPTKYAIEVSDVFFKCLQALLPLDLIAENLKPDFEQKMVTESMLKSLEAYFYSLEVPKQLVENFGPELIDSPPFDLGLVLEAALTLWSTHQAKVDTDLLELFKAADANGDGVLSFAEFESLVRQRVPNCDDRMIMRMFKLCGKENRSGEHKIKPSEFAVVMRIYQSKLNKKIY